MEEHNSQISILVHNQAAWDKQAEAHMNGPVLLAVS